MVNKIFFSGKYKHLESELNDQGSGAIRKRLQHEMYSSVDYLLGKEEQFEAIPNQVH